MKNNDKLNDDSTSRINFSKKGGLKKRNFLAVIVCVLLACALFIGGKHIYNMNDFSAKNGSDNKIVNVKIATGTTTKDIGKQLEQSGVIKHASAFDNYVQKNNVNNLKAGDFKLSPNMTLKKIVQQIQKGSNAQFNNELPIGFVVMREGENAKEFSKLIEKQTKFSSQEWLNTLNDKDYLSRLTKKYPNLLNSAVLAPTRYKLEGYLYPATYNVKDAKNPQEITSQMIAKMDQMMQPYYAQIKKENKTVQEVLTLASLVEREAVTQEDRDVIAGVFLNRLDANMSMGSDVAVKYAINDNKTNLSIKDTKIDSPYNLYRYKGLGPGPFNSPSSSAIKAVVYPAKREEKYYYFIANLKTKKVYFTHNISEHNKLNEKLVKENNNTK